MRSTDTEQKLGLGDEFDDELTDVTIDSVLKELTVWRDTKAEHKQPGFPDSLWRRIVCLGQQHGVTKIRALFAISSEQYRNKAAQFALHDDQDITPDFMEMPEPAVVKTPSSPSVQSTQSTQAAMSQPIYQPTDVTMPDANTMSVVELCRADGLVMKIYTVKDQWPALMQAFSEMSAP